MLDVGQDETLFPSLGPNVLGRHRDPKLFNVLCFDFNDVGTCKFGMPSCLYSCPSLIAPASILVTINITDEDDPAVIKVLPELD